MSSSLSPAAISALKEALCAAFWHKADLRGFLQQSLFSPAVLGILNWEGYKRQIVSDLVDHVVRGEERLPGDLARLCHEVCSLSSFGHLQVMQGGAQKALRASAAVARLRASMEPLTNQVSELLALEHRQQLAKAKLRASVAVRQRLANIQAHYLSLIGAGGGGHQGPELEQVLYDVFELFDLDPGATFRCRGEQIDGTFTLEHTDYLFEARWQAAPVQAVHLNALASKVRRSLDNTLGVYLSVHGYSADGVRQHCASGSAMLLLDGTDLLAVLEERIDLVSLLLRKKMHATQTGNLYLATHEALA